MVQRLTAMAAAVMALVVTSCLAVTPDEMSRAMPEKLEHPYLYFSQEDLPELRGRVENDDVCKGIYDRLLTEGEKLLSTEVEKIPPREDRNPRYTGDWSFHNYIDRNRDRALRLAFLYQMTGEVKYAEKAFEFAEVVCDVSHWEDRAHQFPIIYSRVMPWNVPDDQVVFNQSIYRMWEARLPDNGDCKIKKMIRLCAILSPPSWGMYIRHVEGIVLKDINLSLENPVPYKY